MIIVLQRLNKVDIEKYSVVKSTSFLSILHALVSYYYNRISDELFRTFCNMYDQVSLIFVIIDYTCI